MALENVLQGSGREEIFLPKTQFLPGHVRVGRIQYTRQCIGLVALGKGADMVAGVELVEEYRVDRHAWPKAQGVHALGPPTNDWGIVGDRQHPFARLPDIALNLSVLAGYGLDLATEPDLKCAFAALKFPGITVIEPGFRQFHLPSILQFLSEHAVGIAYAVAMRRDVHRRHGFHETGGQ